MFSNASSNKKPSSEINMSSANFALPNWWSHSVLYYVNIKTLQDTTGDGYGDIPGLTKRLDYIDGLGVDGIIIPAWDILVADDITTNYKKINPLCGTETDIRQLVMAAHMRRLKLVLAMPNMLGKSENAIDIKHYWQKIGIDAIITRQQLAIINPSVEYTCYSARRATKWLKQQLVDWRNVLPIRGAMTDNPGVARAIQPYYNKHNIDQLSKLFAVFNCVLPGCVVINQGQPLGQIGVSVAMAWDDGRNGGFTDTKSMINLDDNYRQTCVLNQDTDQSSPLAFWRHLINLRKSNMILHDGKLQLVSDKKPVITMLRTLGEQSLLIIINLSNKSIRPHTGLNGNLVCSSYQGRTDLVDGILNPYEAVIIKM